MRVLRVLAALAAVTLVAVPTTASAFHSYSIGTDNGSRQGNSYYSGVSVQRDDYSGVTFQMSVTSDCSATFNGNIAYQTMWVIMDPSAKTWLELGTAHKTCTGGRSLQFWYGWMSNPNGFSASLFTTVVGSGVHRFFVVNGTDGYWRWYVDQTQFTQYYWTTLGVYVQAGLESYDQAAHIHENFYNGMVKTINRGAWQNWVDNSHWANGPNMGGNYVDPNDAYAYESTP